MSFKKRLREAMNIKSFRKWIRLACLAYMDEDFNSFKLYIKFALIEEKAYRRLKHLIKFRNDCLCGFDKKLFKRHSEILDSDVWDEFIKTVRYCQHGDIYFF